MIEKEKERDNVMILTSVRNRISVKSKCRFPKRLAFIQKNYVYLLIKAKNFEVRKALICIR